MKHENGSRRCSALCGSHSGGNSVALVVLSPNLLGSRSRQYLFRNKSALKLFNQNNQPVLHLGVHLLRHDTDRDLGLGESWSSMGMFTLEARN